MFALFFAIVLNLLSIGRSERISSGAWLELRALSLWYEFHCSFGSYLLCMSFFSSDRVIAISMHSIIIRIFRIPKAHQKLIKLQIDQEV